MTSDNPKISHFLNVLIVVLAFVLLLIMGLFWSMPSAPPQPEYHVAHVQGVTYAIWTSLDVARDDKALLNIAERLLQSDRGLVILQVWTDERLTPRGNLLAMSERQLQGRYAVVTINRRTGFRGVERDRLP